MAEITDENTPTTQTPADILSGITSNESATGKQVTADDIFTYTPEMSPYEQNIYSQINKYQTTPALPPMSEGMMFPSNQNINKGSYSGSEVGSIPIYAPGGLVPFGVFDQRDRAVQNAAMMKAKQIDDFKKTFAAPVTKHTSVQPKLDEEYYNGLNKWKDNAQKKYGDNWVQALNSDVNFQKWNQSMHTIKTMEDGLVDHVAQLEAKAKDKDYILSPETKKSIADFKQGLTGLSNPFDPNGHQLNDRILRMTAEDNLDTVVNTSVDKLIQDVKETNPGVSDSGIYDILTSTKTTGTSKEKINDLADSIYKTHYGDSSYFTKDDISKRLKTVLGTKVERNFKTERNQFDVSASGNGAAFKYDNNDFEKEPGTMTVGTDQPTVDANGNPVPGVNKTVDVPVSDGITFKKSIPVEIPKNSNITDLSTGKPLEDLGVKKISLGKSFIVPFNSEGKMITQEIADKMKALDPKSVIYKAVVSGKYTKAPDPNNLTAKPTEQSVIIPMNDVENSLVKEWGDNGKVKTGIPVDEYKKKVDALNGGGSNTSTAKTVSMGQIKNLVGKPGYEGYSEKELTDYYTSQGYTVK